MTEIVQLRIEDLIKQIESKEEKKNEEKKTRE